MNLARVVAVHPESNMVDLVMLVDNRRVPGVRVMSHDASSTSGTIGLPKPGAQALPNPYSAPLPTGRELVACVAYYDAVPVVQGFLFPQVAECLFADPERVLARTPSDFYHTVDGKGNAEWFHPSGAYLRIATDPAHEDLTGADFNGRFAATRNAGNAVHIHIEQAGGKASVDIDPAGNIVIKSAASLTADIAGEINVHSGGSTTVKADGGATVVAPSVLVDSPDSHFTGTVTVDGLLTFKGGMAGSGGSGGATASITGAVAVSGGDVTANGISLVNHTHGGVKAGSDSSGPPA